jgi:hypothetical protein
MTQIIGCLKCPVLADKELTPPIFFAQLFHFFVADRIFQKEQRYSNRRKLKNQMYPAKYQYNF